MNTNSINLLRNQDVLSVKELNLLTQVRRLSLIGGGIVIGVGCIIGAAYFIGRVQLASLTEQKERLLQRLNTQAKKQILLLSIKDRLPFIAKALDSQYPWENVLGQILSVASPPLLRGLIIEENNVITLKVTTQTFQEAQQIIDTAQQLEEEGKVEKSQIESLRIGNNQEIDMVFSFMPIR